MGKFVKEKAEAGAPVAWMLTYADMMSLLLAFFIAIVSYSTVSADKYDEAVRSLKGAFRASGVAVEQLLSVKPTESMESAARALQSALQVAGRDQEVRVSYDVGGAIRVAIPSALLFDEPGAALRPDSHDVLAAVAAMLEQVKGHPVDVSAHTDDSGMVDTAQFRDSLDLSYARADTVARRLCEYSKGPLDLFTLSGCGGARPVATNETEEGRASNRRVEILVRGAAESSKMRSAREQLEGMVAPSVAK